MEEQRNILLEGVDTIIQQRVDESAEHLIDSCRAYDAVDEERKKAFMQLLNDVSENINEIKQEQPAMAAQIEQTCTQAIDTESFSSQGVRFLTDGKMIVGESEIVHLMPPAEDFYARVDSGATTSSLDARDMVVFERDGEDWVRFNLVHNDTGEAASIELEVERFVKIRQANSPKPERRPVVKLKLRLGSFDDYVEFSLADRSAMVYPVLLGRRFLRDVAVVDVARQYVQGGEELVSDVD